MPISKRLQAIARLVPPCDTVADIGCDHGQLAYLLLQWGICRRVIACDVREKPLARARKLLNDDPRVTFACCDGLECAKDAQVAVIAGMGGGTIQGILARQPETARRLQLVLQPSTGAPELRAYLMQQAFRITDERILQDERFYPLLFVEGGEMPALSALELELGPANIARRDALTLAYAAWRLAVYQKTVQRPASTQKGLSEQRLLQAKMDLLKGFLGEVQT